MERLTYKYEFARSVDMSEMAETLLLAVTAAEGLHGRARVNLEAEFDLDEDRRTCRIDASNEVGRDIARIFVGLLTCEIGEDAFRVTRLNKEQCA